MGRAHRDMDLGVWLAFQQKFFEGDPQLATDHPTKKVQEMHEKNLRHGHGGWKGKFNVMQLGCGKHTARQPTKSRVRTLY